LLLKLWFLRFARFRMLLFMPVTHKRFSPAVCLSVVCLLQTQTKCSHLIEVPGDECTRLCRFIVKSHRSRSSACQGHQPVKVIGLVKFQHEIRHNSWMADCSLETYWQWVVHRNLQSVWLKVKGRGDCSSECQSSGLTGHHRELTFSLAWHVITSVGRGLYAQEWSVTESSYRVFIM